jgi:hypothetical protein
LNNASYVKTPDDSKLYKKSEVNEFQERLQNGRDVHLIGNLGKETEGIGVSQV